MPEARVIQLHSAESIAQAAAESARTTDGESGPSARVDPIDRKTRPSTSRTRSAAPRAGARSTATGPAAAAPVTPESPSGPDGLGAADTATRTEHEARATEQAVAESAAHHPSAQPEITDAGLADAAGVEPDLGLGQAEILERYDEAVARWAHALGGPEVDALLADGTDATDEPEHTAASAGSVISGEAPDAAAGPPMSPLERKVAGGLAFLRRRVTGDYEVDEFGFDRDLVGHVVAPGFTPIYTKWFRTEVLGADNIPTDGGALLVANHAGGIWALDGAITTLAIYRETPNRRVLRMLGADLVFTTPGLAPFARKSGATLACNADAERLLERGELVGVWPEGFKGIGKPFSERYKLQRFGRGGFVTAALRAGVPIIPISIVGSEEIHPVLGNAKTLARLLNVPYFPITPTFPWLGPLGLVPFPSKWYIEFGEPIPTSHYGPEGADDPMLVFELTDRVRETIQSTLYRLLVKRRSVWR